jgi:hypothetical protein
MPETDLKLIRSFNKRSYSEIIAPSSSYYYYYLF